jgi:hypothetical protein
MRWIIEARLADSDTVTDSDEVLAVIERRGCSLAQLGPSLAKGCTLLAKVQAGLVSKQVEGSAMNQVVSHRMAKKQQMRWTDERAHCMAQVRIAVLNGELHPAVSRRSGQRPCGTSSAAGQRRQVSSVYRTN